MNIFDATAQIEPNIIDNCYLNYIGGNNYIENRYFFISSKLPVSPNTLYHYTPCWGNAQEGFRGKAYSANDEYICDINTESFTTPSGAAYVRFSVFKLSNWKNTVLELEVVEPPLDVPAEASPVGIKANFLGDSITSGDITPGAPYPDMVKSLLNLAVIRNYGTAGLTIEGMIVKTAIMDPDADIVCFMGGVNDFAVINDIAAFSVSVDTLILNLVNKYPDKLVIGITMPRIVGGGYGSRLGMYADTFQKACQKFSVPCLDLFNNFADPNIPAQKEVYYGDDIHQNALGKALIARKIALFISAQ